MPYQLSRKIGLRTILETPNLCTLFDEDDLKYIGTVAQEGYETDRVSRTEWTLRQSEANLLALQVYQDKTFPWKGAANVKFPLVTNAAMQYQSRAYPSLVSGTDLVKVRVIGEDPQGQKKARANRIATHMSWQNLEQDESWEEEMDKTLLVSAIAGCAFKKRIYEPGPRRQVSMLVMPKNLVINYWAKDLATCERYTHTFPLSHNNIKQREMDGRFRTITEAQPVGSITQDEIEIARDERQGITKPQDDQVTPYFTGEQYCWWDFDGDGYQEPYIVTFDIASGQVRRIVARFVPGGVRNRDGGTWESGQAVYKIHPVKTFTKYGFIPSPDGGYLDLGLGSILGPINESINTALNQMLDAGTMATLGGGFLGRGFKSKAGPITFEPFQWYPVDAPGDDLRKNILPLPIREPSNVLFQLLGLLIQYGERMVSSTDLQVGENIGQNTPAETTRTLNENGARVYNALRKRAWRSMRDEFRIQYDLNQMFLDADQDYEDLTSGQGAMIRPDDYQGSSLNVRPAADPHVASDAQKVEQAKVVFANAFQVPGHNKYLATRNLYVAMGIPDIDNILPPPMQPDPQNPQKMVPARDFPPLPNPKMLEQQRKDKELQLEQQDQQFQQAMEKIRLQMEAMRLQAEILELESKAMKYRAEAGGVETGHQIALIEAQIGAKKAHMESLLKAIELLQKGREDGGSAMAGTGLAGMAQSPANEGIPGLSRGNGQGSPGAMA